MADAGEVVSKMVIDYGAAKKVTGVGLDTFTVHAKASTEDLVKVHKILAMVIMTS